MSAAVFSPDGQRIAYMSDGAADVFDTLYERPADGTGDGSLLFEFGVIANHYVADWSLDGFLLYDTREPRNAVGHLGAAAGRRAATDRDCENAVY